MSGIVGSYFNTRGSGVVAKLGTDGQVFTSTGAGLSQGFEAAAGGGDYVKIASTDLSGDATIVDLQGCFTATYDSYVLRGTGLTLGAANYPRIAFLDSSNNVMTGSSYYTKQDQIYGTWSGNPPSLSGVAQNETGGFRMINTWDWNNADEPSMFEMHFWNPLSTSFKPAVHFWCTWNQTSPSSEQAGLAHGIGLFDDTTAHHGIRMTVSGDNFSNHGNLAIYGIKQ